MRVDKETRTERKGLAYCSSFAAHWCAAAGLAATSLFAPEILFAYCVVVGHPQNDAISFVDTLSSSVRSRRLASSVCGPVWMQRQLRGHKSRWAIGRLPGGRCIPDQNSDLDSNKVAQRYSNNVRRNPNCYPYVERYPLCDEHGARASNPDSHANSGGSSQHPNCIGCGNRMFDGIDDARKGNGAVAWIAVLWHETPPSTKQAVL